MADVRAYLSERAPKSQLTAPEFQQFVGITPDLHDDKSYLHWSLRDGDLYTHFVRDANEYLITDATDAAKQDP